MYRCVRALFHLTKASYFGLTTELSKKMLRGIALALGGSANDLEGDIAGDPFWVTRFIGYPVISKENDHKEPENGVGW